MAGAFDMHKLEPDRAWAQHQRMAASASVENASTPWMREQALKEYAYRVDEELRIVARMLEDEGDISSERWAELSALQRWLLDQQSLCADQLDEAEDEHLAKRVKELQANLDSYEP